MQNYKIYLSQLKEISIQIYQNQLFQQLVIILTILIFFLFGRLSHEKRLTHLLETINDAQTTKKNLTSKLEKQKKIVSRLQSKKKIFWILLIIIVILNAAIFYFTQKIIVIYIVYTVVPFLLLSLCYLVGIKWSQWNRDATQKRLKNTSITAQTQIKEILNIFGPGLKQNLKRIYQSEIQLQAAKQSQQQCKLLKCHNDKRSYEELYKLYEQIIDEIKKINMCDVCLSQNNISVQKLGLNELQSTLRNYKRAKAGKLNLAQKKQMVNKLLAEYQKVGEKLPYICKKGCCIKQRQIIENAKTKFYDKLKRISSQISSNEKK